MIPAYKNRPEMTDAEYTMVLHMALFGSAEISVEAHRLMNGEIDGRAMLANVRWFIGQLTGAKPKDDSPDHR